MPLRDILHQDSAVDALRRALAGGRLHHAYLFAGPDGIGKGLAAQALAEALLCAVPRGDGDACGQCPSCRRSAARGHPDLHIVERGKKPDGAPEASIRIDQVRALQRALSFKAYEGGRRVVLMLEPDRMNPSTANALLKTLEEPGPNTHFALVTDSPHRLLPTILSRCQRVRFGPLPRAFVAEQITTRVGLDAETADLVAGLAEGSIGRAIQLADSPLMSERAALLERADPPTGLAAAGDLLDLAEQLARQKDALPMVFRLLRTWFRDALLVHQGFDDAALVHRDLADAVRARAVAVPAPVILDRIDRLNETERTINDGSANARLALEAMFLAFARKSRARA